MFQTAEVFVGRDLVGWRTPGEDGNSTDIKPIILRLVR